MFLTASYLLLCFWLHPSTQSCLFKQNARSQHALPSVSLLVSISILLPRSPAFRVCYFPSALPSGPGHTQDHSPPARGTPSRHAALLSPARTLSTGLGSPRLRALATPRAPSFTEPRLLGSRWPPLGLLLILSSTYWPRLQDAPCLQAFPVCCCSSSFWPRLMPPPHPSHTFWICLHPVPLAAQASLA